ncbi:MAG: hypothetical protein IJN46_08255 [Lachnospiraceae bacterium]|nr:hypothetical protein [Lachnospiraceae bacterium]
MEKGESKSERFVRIAESRVNKIIKMIKLLGNLSGSNYEYTSEQIAHIFSVLQSELNHARMQYYETKKKRRRFSLVDTDEIPGALEAYPDLFLMLSDGSYLRAIAFDHPQNPALNVYLGEFASGKLRQICFVEEKQGKESENELCIGVYQSNSEETVYYEPYRAERNNKNDGEDM